VSDRKYAIKVLEEKGEVIIRCNGNSMQPIIQSQEAIHLVKVDLRQLRVGDAVFCKINKNYQVHKITAIDKDRYQISNNKGWVNGWIGANSIYGLAVKIEDRILVSDKELTTRMLEALEAERKTDMKELDAAMKKNS
jgi:signal peptidase I